MKMWHPALGDGILYYRGEKTDRFEASSGTTIALDWREAKAGRPGKRLGQHGTEEWNWMTFKLRSGDVYSFRRGGKRS
jgi:hypothetical protein